jgi:hypothetical protein
MSSPSRFLACLLAWPVTLTVAIGCTDRPEVSNTTGGSMGAGGSRGGSSGNAGGSSGGNAGGSSAGGSSGGLDAFVLPDVPGTGGSSGATDADQGDERQCGLENFKLEKTPPDLMLVLDRSSSMNQMVPGAAMGATLWTETLAAVDAVVMGTQAGVNWGLKLFPLPTGCMVSPGAEVPVAASNYMPVITRARMEGTNNAGGGVGMTGTPTDTAVIGATTYLTSLVATRKNPKYILLATDGEPTCINGVNGGGTTAAINAITAAKNAGFKVYVIGLAIGAAGTNTLNLMAEAGGVPRNDPMTKFYPVANRADLVATLTAITGQVTNCVFPLSKPPPVPTNVKVTVDGMKVEENMMNGWSYTSNNMAIQFNGALCEQIKMGTAQVNIVFGCPGVVIP